MGGVHTEVRTRIVRIFDPSLIYSEILRKQKIRNNILYLLEREDLHNRFGKFKGVGRKTAFLDPIADSRETRSVTVPVGATNEEPSEKLNCQEEKTLKDGVITPAPYSKKTSVSLSQKIDGKNFRIADVNTEMKLNSVFNKFQQKGMPNDKLFYPNPERLLHPLKVLLAEVKDSGAETHSS